MPVAADVYTSAKHDNGEKKETKTKNRYAIEAHTTLVTIFTGKQSINK